MGFIYPNLCRELDKMGITVDVLAEKLNIPEDSVWSKLCGDSSWTLAEIVRVCQILKNPDVKFLFLQLDSNT